MTDQSRFQLIAIPTTARPLLGADRQPLRNPDNSIVGQISASGELLHWHDPDLYTAWVAEARRQWTLATRNRDPVAMQSAAKAVMKACNAANVPWWIDPQLRALHQMFISGLPDPNGPAVSAAFAGSYRYNDTEWLAPDPGRCIIAPSHDIPYGGCLSDNTSGAQTFLTSRPAFGGALAAQAREFYNTKGPSASMWSSSPIQFLPRMQFVVRVPDEHSRLPAQYFSRNNPNVPLPFDLGILYSATLYNDVIWKTERKQYYVHANGSDASNNPDGYDVWAFDRNAIVGGSPQQIRPSYEAYAPYVSAMISALEGRTAAQMIQDARAYAIWRNAIAVATGGSLQNLFGGQVANIEAITTPNGTIATSLQASVALVAAAAAAVGAAIGPVTGGVGALVGGAVAGIAAVAAQYVPPDLSRVYIDDVERPKPWIERSWLSGDPTDVNQSPALNLDSPPGWVRPYRQSVRGQTLAVLKRQLGTLNSPGLQIPSAVWWVLGGLAIGGGIVYAGSRLTQGRSRSRSRSRTRRFSR